MMKIIKSLFGQKKNIPSEPINSADFKKLIAKYFAPKLREQGWKGSGFHFRKMTDNHYVYLLSFQPDKYGGKCWVEVGVHLDFLKNLDGEVFNLKRIDCTWVDIRRRISPDESNNYTWQYQDAEDKNKKVIDNIWNVFATDGMNFFNQFIEFLGPFQNITTSDIDNRDKKYQIKGIPLPPDVRTAWYLAQVFDFDGNKDKASDFAKFGISRIKGRQGSALKADLEKIRTKNSS
jgi:hypothetical protein